MIRKKNVLIILMMTIAHMALSVCMIGAFIVAAVVTHSEVKEIPLIMIIIMPYIMLSKLPLFESLAFVIMPLYSCLFTTALYFSLRKIIWIIKNRRQR